MEFSRWPLAVGGNLSAWSAAMQSQRRCCNWPARVQQLDTLRNETRVSRRSVWIYSPAIAPSALRPGATHG